MVLGRYNAQQFCRDIGGTVSAGFPLHQNEFDVILDYGVRFVWLSQKPGAIFDFVNRVGYFVPDDWGQVIESDLSATLLDRRVKRNDGVPTFILPARKANIADHANQPTTWNQCLEAIRPNLIQFIKKLVVVLNVSQLPFGVPVLFESPIWRRREYEMD